MTKNEFQGVAAHILRVAMLGAVIYLPACGRMVLGEPGVTRSQREAYEITLHAREGDVAVREWLDAGAHALTRALAVSTPYHEAVLLGDAGVGAIGYRIELGYAQRFDAEVDPPFVRRGGVFVELFRMDGDSATLVAAAAPGEHSISTRAPAAGSYVLRVHPRPGHGGLYRIALGDPAASAPDRVTRAGAALLFPVSGKDARAIRSGFGDPRDGGARSHRGVDIFADRGTPALAAADAVVTDVGNGDIGGRVVWLSAPDLGLEFYYAHLDEQLVREGDRVRAGDPVGRVGNTGNASRTSPHLHFGVYRTGGRIALDPEPVLENATASAVPVSVHLALQVDPGSLGEWRRTRTSHLPLSATPDLAERILSELPRHTPVRLVGTSDRALRVSLPDGRTGFFAAAELESIPAASEARIERDAPLRTRPAEDAPVIETLPRGRNVPVLATFGDFLLVRGPGGQTGWIPRR